MHTHAEYRSQQIEDTAGAEWLGVTTSEVKRCGSRRKVSGAREHAWEPRQQNPTFASDTGKQVAESRRQEQLEQWFPPKHFESVRTRRSSHASQLFTLERHHESRNTSNAVFYRETRFVADVYGLHVVAVVSKLGGRRTGGLTGASRGRGEVKQPSLPGFQHRLLSNLITMLIRNNR